jgi:hypothetical protein
LQDLHQHICALISSGAVRPLFLQHVHIVEQNAQKLVLSCKSAPLLKMMQTPDKIAHYKKAAAQVLGQELHIAFQVAGASIVQPIAPPANAPAKQGNPLNTLEGQTLIPVEVMPVSPAPLPLQNVATPALVTSAAGLFPEKETEPVQVFNEEDEQSLPKEPMTPLTQDALAPITIQGSGDDLEASKLQAVALLNATDVAITTVDDEDTGVIQGTLLDVTDATDDE